MEKENIEIFNKSDFERLAKVNDPLCISFYIPTYRAGEAVKQAYAPKTLKNQIKAVKENLSDRNLSENEIEVFLRPVINLIDNKEFWTKQSDGLGIFLCDKGMEMFKLPIHFEAKHYLANHYYLKPLVPMLNKNDLFYILALSIDNLKLYECTPYTIAEIDTSDFPQQLEDVVGYDKNPDHLDQRSGQDDQGSAIFHGHGSAKDSKSKEIKKFVKEVDRKLNNLLKKQSDPLILACDKQHFGIYNKISHYNNLTDTFIPGNPEYEDAANLHAMAYDKLKNRFSQKKAEKIKTFLNISATGQTMSDIYDIVPAAVTGRVDTLFIRNDKEAYGLYDKANHAVIIDKEKLPQNASLFNLAAVNTLLNNGHVYLMDKNEMPLVNTNANALLRY
jgi:hypothetical protein